MTKVAVSGGNGFIGSALVQYLSNCGYEVFSLQRKKNQQGNIIYFDLQDPNSIPDLNGFDFLIHTAFIPHDKFHPHSSNENIKGTIALYEKCKATGCRFIFLSSMSAHSAALSDYGKHKWAIEKKLSNEDCLIIRPGLVIGNGGLFEKIKTSIQNNRIIPLIDGGLQPLQIIALTDLCLLIEKCMTEKRIGKLTLATPQIYTLKEFTHLISKRIGRQVHFINVPYKLVYLGLSIVNFLPLKMNLGLENLLGLKQLQAEDNKADMEKMKCKILDLEQAIEKCLIEKK